MGWVNLVVLSFGMAVALTLMILSCALDNVWWPLMTLVPYIAIPMPFLLCGESEAFSTSISGWRVTGLFATGAFVVAVFAIPAIELHLGSISGRALGYCLAADVVLFLVFALFGWMRSR